jgi:glycosyltransferase involved in cell wall biosynthesis
MDLRLLGITQGSTGDPMASSGLNASVFGACARQATLAGVLDVSLHGLGRYWNALLHFSPDRDRWRERFDLNVCSFRRLSRRAGREIARREGTFDVILQLRTLFAPGLPPGAWPYALLLDNTYALSDRHYPPWAPMRAAEKRRWLALERETYHRAAAVFARTHWVRRSLIEDYGVPEERAVWVGSGSHYQPRPEGRAAGGNVILFVGKELQRKGVDTLLQAFREVRGRVEGARLVVVGRDLPVRPEGVEAPGKVVDRERLRGYYEQAAVFALPAVFEPCGNVVAEAMAHGLPCVVSDGGGLAEFVEEGRTGFVVPAGDPTALARRLITLLENEALREEMGRNGRDRVCRELTWDAVAARMLPHLQRAADPPPADGRVAHA